MLMLCFFPLLLMLTIIAGVISCTPEEEELREIANKKPMKRVGKYLLIGTYYSDIKGVFSTEKAAFEVGKNLKDAHWTVWKVTDKKDLHGERVNY